MSKSNLYALLIGINCYLSHRLSKGNCYTNLQGAVNDINAVEGFLKNRLSLPETHIWKLTASNPNPFLKRPVEPPEQIPTYANIIAKFKEVTATAQAGDQIYIHYSGHGGRTKTAYPEIKGEAGVDESLVPVDIGQLDASGQPVNCYVRDLELAWLLKQMEKKGAIVTVVFDSCHSGGATRGKAQARGTDTIDQMPQQTSSLVASREELLENWRSLRLAERGASKLHFGFLPKSKDYVFLAACCPSEIAFEYDFKGDDFKQRHGALTYWLLDSLEQGYTSLSYKDIYDRIRAKVQSQFPQQTPVLLGEADRLIFGSDRTFVQNFLSVQKIDRDKQQVTINAGIITGIRKGTQLAIYPIGMKDFTQTEARLAIAEVIQYSATLAECKIDLIEGKREVALGDPATLLAPPATLVRKVGFFFQQEATLEEMKLGQLAPNKLPPNIYAKQRKTLNSLRPALYVFGQNWLEWAEINIEETSLSRDADEKLDFYLYLNDLEEYEICDSAGVPYSNINPSIKLDEPRAGEKVIRRLVHLSKYRAVQELYNSASPLIDKFQVKWLGKLEDYAEGVDPHPTQLKNLQPLDDPINPTIKEGEWIFLEIINFYSSPLKVVVLDLQSNWAIEQTWPKPDQEMFVEISPGLAHREVIPFPATLPNGDKQRTDIIKVFATLGEAELRGLALPALDRPIIVPPIFRGYRSSDPLSLLAKAIAQEQPQSRRLKAAYFGNKWVVKESRVKVRQV